MLAANGTSCDVTLVAAPAYIGQFSLGSYKEGGVVILYQLHSWTTFLVNPIELETGA